MAVFLSMLARIAFLIQLVLGIILWTGQHPGLTAIHIAFGLVFVGLVWALAVLSLLSNRTPLAWAAIVWGFVVVLFGLLQTVILVGDTHWLIQVLHLLIGVVALGLAEMVTARMRRARLP